MNYCQLNLNDTTNGEGIRISLFLSGCEHQCKGCFSPETWNYDYGKKFDDATKEKIFSVLRKYPEIDGLSLLGGDPLAPKNRDEVANFLQQFKKEFPDKTVWLWTGYVKEYIDKHFPDVLNDVDVLVDGPFIEAKKDDKLEWRGSGNQRVIYLKRIKDFVYASNQRPK